MPESRTSRRSRNSSRLCQSCCWLFMLSAISHCLLTTVAPSVATPSSDMDSIGSYRVVTDQQCSKLCWYRLLCTAYSFYVGRVGGGDGEKNCVLHANSVEGAATGSYVPAYPNWTRTNVKTEQHPSNSCTSRPCGPTQICIPALEISDTHTNQQNSHNALQRYKCVSAPAECPGSPSALSNASITVNRRLQGDAATVVCDKRFVLSPNDTTDVYLCQVNSLWTSPVAQCVEYKWSQPSFTYDFMADFPFSLSNGWGMCIHGVMVANDRMFLNFMSEQPVSGNFYNLPLHLDLRFTGAVYDSILEGQYQGLADLGAMPLGHNDEYTLSITKTEEYLHVDLVGETSYSIPLASQGRSGIDLSTVTAIWIGHDVQFTYVNLIAKCNL